MIKFRKKTSSSLNKEGQIFAYFSAKLFLKIIISVPENPNPAVCMFLQQQEKGVS
jgi:hypothetical protein